MFTIACCVVVGLGLGLGVVLVGVWSCIRICATLGCNCHTADLCVVIATFFHSSALGPRCNMNR